MGHEKAPTTFYIFKRWWALFRVLEILNLMTLYEMAYAFIEAIHVFSDGRREIV
jgi:hypothetical protein